MAIRVRLKWLAVAMLCAIGFAEAAVRLSGAVDFAVYQVDSKLGYVPAPNQAGRFLRKNSWAFNDKSMATAAPWDPGRRPNLLLIGNSVVMGGNPYDERDKLGPLLTLETYSRYSVWPIAAGGWSDVNEMTYLERHPEVVSNANFFVWEYMAGGLHALSVWRGEYVFPSKHPICATCYVARRYLVPYLFSIERNALPPTGPLLQAYFDQLDTSVATLCHATATARCGLIFLYPDKRQLALARAGTEWLPERRALEDLAQRNGLAVVDVAASPDWNLGLYRDGTHPTTQGNRALARILAAAIRETDGSLAERGRR